MNIFQSNIDALKKSSPAKPSKRFVCFVIDLVLVALLAEGIFAGAFVITKSTSAYTEAAKILDEEIAYYEDLTEKTHVVEYVDGARVSTDVTVLKNLYRAIYLSFEVFGNAQQPEFTFEEGHDVTVNGIHSRESDNVAYFYTRYLKEDSSLNIKADDNIFEIYKRAFGSDASVMFTFDGDISDMPVLNTQVAYYMFHYLFVNSSDAIGQTGSKYYDAYYRGYANMLEEAENLILQSEPYYSTHYVKYTEAYSAEARYTNIALTLSIIISSLIILLIPMYLFKDGRTLGCKIMGIGMISAEGESVEWYVPLSKAIFGAIGLVPLAIILYMFPPFNGGFDAMFTPITAGARLSFAWIILGIAVIGGIANSFALFTHKRQNLFDMIFGDVVVDLHYVDEGERDETNQGREY